MTTLKAWCVVVGLWLARLGGWTPPTLLAAEVLPIPPAVLRQLARTRALMAHENEEPNAAPEAKRHRVLARLIKDGMTHGDAALAIEVVARRW